MAIIHVTDYPIHVKIGYFPKEQLAGQNIKVSLKATLDNHLRELSKGNSDALETTLDYGKILACLDSNLSGQKIKLLETAVLIAGNGLIESFPIIKSLEITIEKPVIPDGVSKSAVIKISETFASD